MLLKDGNVKLIEFTILAEIFAMGALVLAGTGVETGLPDGLTSKFERK